MRPDLSGTHSVGSEANASSKLLDLSRLRRERKDPQVTIQNVVASVTLKQRLDLDLILKVTEGVSYKPENFPGIVYKLKNPKASALLFGSGKMVCTGTTSEERRARMVGNSFGLHVLVWHVSGWKLVESQIRQTFPRRRRMSGGFETLFGIFSSLDLRFVERVLSSCYKPEGSVGRPHRSLLGMFKAEMAKRLGSVERYRELDRLLRADAVLRSLCEIKEWERPYGRSTLAEFRQRIGPERLERIIAYFIKQLDEAGVLNGETLALDATFVEAYSQRDPHDSSRGLFDSEARLRKQGRNVTLGYGVHLAVDTGSEMPSAVVVEPANVNEKKIAAPLLRKTLKHKKRWRNLVADTQYSSQNVRDEVKRLRAKPVIPYPRNQAKGKRVLRVDRKFRLHGPARLKRLYRRRSAVERAISRLKHYFGLKHLRTRGLRNAIIHTLLCILAMLTTALSSILHGHSDLIRSPVSLMKLTGKL